MRTSRSGNGMVGLGVALVAAAAFAVPLVSFAVQETAGDQCLVEVKLNDPSVDVPDGSTLCAVATGKICTFNLGLCRNQPGCLPGTFKKTIKTTGHCNPGKLKITKAQSPCGSFVGIKVRTKKNGRKMGSCNIRVSAKPSDKPPRKDVDKVTLMCMPATGTCPGAATTTTVSTTTTTTGTIPAGSLAFTSGAGTTSCGGAGLASPPSAPLNGELDSDTAGTTKITDLGLGCLYVGGGNAKGIPPGRVPDGATNFLGIQGTNLVASAGQGAASCTKGAGPGTHCINDDTLPACTNDAGCGGTPNACQPDANCFFGPPLEFPNPVLTALTTCVLNVMQMDASGTGDAATGSSTVSLPLSSRVYVTSNVTSPCPHCVSGSCTYGANALGPCTTTTSFLTSIDCPPEMAGGAFQAPLPVTLNPFTTGSAPITAADGNFCPSQKTAGAFGQPTAQRIVVTGSPAGDLTDGLPHASTLGAAFCIPATNNVAVDGVADLPGPGATTITGMAQVHP